MTVQSVSLGDLLTLVRRKVDVVAEGQYPEIGVRSYGRGLFHKQPRSGLEVGDKELFLVHEGDFILQVTFAWEGAVAVAKSEDHGLFGSVRMLTFRVDENRCLPEFLQFYFRTPAGVEQLVRISPGSAGRNRVLNKSRLREVFVPLPSLAEQRRIVAKIERLAGKIEEARGLREQATELNRALFDAALRDTFAESHKWYRDRFGDMIQTTVGQIDPTVEPYASLPHINGEYMESGTGRLLDGHRIAMVDGVISGKYHFPPGSVLYSKIRPYLRKAVVVPFEGICSADIYAIEKIDDRLNADFLKYVLIGPDFTAYANTLSGRTRMPKLNQDQFFAFNIAFPSLDEQFQIVAHLDSLQSKSDHMKRLQSQIAAELDTLLPAFLDRAFKGEL